MNETEVNEVVASWLKSQGRTFKGTLTRNRDVPVPCCDNEGDGEGRVCLDFLSPEPPAIWVESKGDVDQTTLLSAVAKVCFATFYLSGKGVVAAPSKQISWLLHHKDFLVPFIRMFEPETIGLFDAERAKIEWI